jgi:ABC-type polysaccharide/polyol phosphate transport system ATPase subunit
LVDAPPGPDGGGVDPAIEVENLEAQYLVRLGGASMRDGVFGRFRRGEARARIVPALRGVSFSVPRGSVFGIIGRNGAGKSTLLRALAGIIPPATGRITVRGQVSSLLAAGIGFNQNLTGRDNINLGALARGFTEERLDTLADEIAEFAQLGEYLDLPMRGYSSGMTSRLGFAIAAHLDPEILLIDEALAGGDSKYKERVSVKLLGMREQRKTLVIVTHSLVAIRSMATTCLWLHQGKVVALGEPEDVVNSYMRYCRIERSEESFDEDY